MTHSLRLVRDMWRRLTHPIEALRRAVLAPASPVNLTVLRVLIYGRCLQGLWGQSYSWDEVRDLYDPVGIYRLVELPNDRTLEIMLHAGQCAALLCVIGLAFRPASIVCALTFPYLLGSGNNFGKVDHASNLLAIVLLVLPFSRAADFGSIEWWLKRRKNRAPVTPSGEYRWPIFATWLATIGMYWSAGVSKLVHSGWDWALSDNFQLLLVRHHLTHQPPTDLGLVLAQVPSICKGLALFALLSELLCPLALLGGGWALLMGGLLFGLQVGVYLLLGVGFVSMGPILAAFFPWRAVLEPLWRRFTVDKRTADSKDARTRFDE
jgi:hypothetical protein